MGMSFAVPDVVGYNEEAVTRVEQEYCAQSGSFLNV